MCRAQWRTSRIRTLTIPVRDRLRTIDRDRRAGSGGRRGLPGQAFARQPRSTSAHRQPVRAAQARLHPFAAEHRAPASIARGLAIAAAPQGDAAAVHQLGARPSRVYLGHILPNIASTLIVLMTLIFPEVILMESGLPFLGLGVQPPMTSLGNRVGYGRESLTRAPWIMLAPATIIVRTTLAVSIVGDWLRDRLDPTLS